MCKPSYLLCLFILTTGCDGFGGGGSNTVLKQLPSPDGKTKAYLFERSGGATVGDSYRISIVPAGDTLDQMDLGNAFVVDDNHGNAQMSVNTIVLSWKSSNILEIAYADKLRTFAQEKKVGNVSVVYKLLFK